MQGLRISRSSYKVMPWKNGCGETAEIDRVPRDGESYLWRLSQATIQGDGPFSVFPGYDRWISVWRGGPIFLNEVRIGLLEPYRFSGDVKTFCRVESAPVLDLGLIFDRSKIEASMRIVEGQVSLAPSATHYLFDLDSGDTIKITDGFEISAEKSLLVSVRSV